MADDLGGRAPLQFATTPTWPTRPHRAEEDALDWLENHARRPGDCLGTDEDRIVFVCGVLHFAAALLGDLRR
jgi:hypothetical protein